MSVSPPIQMILRAQIAPGKMQPRIHFDDTSQRELTSSMREHGFLSDHPLLVRRLNEFEFVPIPGENDVDRVVVRVRAIGGSDSDWRKVGEAKITDPDEYNRIAQGALRFEIVKGERRWRSAGELEIEAIPCVVVELSDLQALEQALIENRIRSDLNPLEEALAYRHMDALLAEDRPSLTDRERYTQICQRLGISNEMVLRRRMALCILANEPTGRALIEGRIYERHAVMISSLPTRTLRDEVTKKVLSPTFGDSCMPITQLRTVLLDYQRELRSATFDPKDEHLVEVRNSEDGRRLMGGACTDCPFNTRNQPEDDNARSGSKFHACLHPDCYQAKTDAAREKRAAELEAKGKTVLPSNESARLWDDTGKRLSPRSEYVEVSAKPDSHELKPGCSPDAVPTYGEMIEGSGAQIVVAIDDAGREHELVRRDVAVIAAAKNDHTVFRDSPVPDKVEDNSLSRAAAAATDDEQRQQREKKDREEEEKEAVLVGKVTALAKTMEGRPKPPEGFWKALYGVLSDIYPDGEQYTAFRRGFNDTEAFRKSVQKAPELYVMSCVVEMMIRDGVWNNADDSLLVVMADLYEVDLKAATRDAKNQLKTSRDATAEREAIAKGITWASEKSNVEEFTWNSADVCENPDVASLAFPKSAKLTAEVSVARDEKGWHYGFGYSSRALGGTSAPVTHTSTSYTGRKLALVTGLKEIEWRLKDAKASEDVLKRVGEYINSLIGAETAAPEIALALQRINVGEKVSVAVLQRRLRIGFQAASRVFEALSAAERIRDGLLTSWGEIPANAEAERP